MSDSIALKLSEVSFSYKNSQDAAINNFNLEVEKGSFTTLLGPSGCGKTTLLRLISGFLEPSRGTVEINGINQKGIEPDKRKIGMVFQDYALFPHMTVEQNILYGLKINKTITDENGNPVKLSKAQIAVKLSETASNLDLTDLLNRYPSELSGGQQQRVALARALILNPQILLMDEPLSSLDTKLREKVREELKEIQQKYKITTIYVTHDQEEALSLSDKIAVINKGKLLQTGSPRDIYYKPADSFTADFVGRANFIQIDGLNYVVRPEWFDLNTTKSKGDLEGKVISSAFYGDKTRFKFEAENKIYTVDLPTLSSNFLEADRAISLNINHKWKL